MDVDDAGTAEEDADGRSDGRLLFLSVVPRGGGEVELAEGEAEHARVIGLAAGDRCVGLDGEGGRWPLEVRAIGRRRLEVAVAGPARRTPEPGAEGAALPWIELAVAWPRKNRAERMIAALVPLGAAAITALSPRFRGPEPVPDQPPARWTKLAREALKQCGRTWLPVLTGRTELDELLEARADAIVAMLDPDTGMSFDTWLRSLTPGPSGAPGGIGTRERPIVLAIGPEGGWSDDERDALFRAGATGVWIGPHVLRIETAAEAAMAVAATVLGSPPPRA